MAREMVVILPELSDRNPLWTPDMLNDIPVIYLLHGMSENQTTWTRRTNIERLVERTCVAIVMPATDMAWYTNTTYGMNYYDAIANELPEKIATLFPQISKKREKNFIVGLSMGGYGAFKIAFTTQRYSYAASLSGALVGGEIEPYRRLLSEKSSPQISQYWRGVFGDLTHFEDSENDLLALAQREVLRPKLFAWIGTQDFLLETNEILVPKLKALQYDIVYEKGPGKHEWYYWNQQIDRVLSWLPIQYQHEERLTR
nr:alpha/beta hydrolase family protein [Weissella diestrammenae]